MFEGLMSVADGITKLAAMFRDRPTDTVDQTDSDTMTDQVIGLDAIETALEDFLGNVKREREATQRTLVDLFIGKEQQSVTRRGKTVYLACEYWPAPAFRDLLPAGVDPADPQYASTVARCREHAKDRLLRALKDSGEFRYLVVENFNSQSLRSAFTGKEAPRDELDVPILPEAFAAIVDLNPQQKIRIRKAGK